MQEDHNTSPNKRALAEMEKLLSDTPKSEQETLPPHGIYTDDMGREHNMDEIQAQGIFYVKPDRRFAAAFTFGVMLFIGAVNYAFIWMTNTNLINAKAEVDSPRFRFFLVIELIVLLVTECITFYLCLTRIHGTLHNYKADGRAFYVTVRGKGREQILFKDVLGVAYTPTKLFWGKRGYKVDIITTYGTIHYDYIFPQFNQSVALQNLPFDVIKRNIPQRDNTDQ